VIKTLLLVPVKDNQGHPFQRKDWRDLEERLLQFGGYTRGADVEGAWKTPVKVYRDRSRQYITSLNSWTRLHEWLSILFWARERFRQETMYIEVAGIPEIIG